MSDQFPPPPPPPPAAPGGYPMPPAAPPTHGKATTSLILGIVSIVACGLFTGIPAIILGRQARREIRESGGALGGDGLAQAGFITGLIGTIWMALVTVFVILVFAVGSTAQNEFQSCSSTIQGDPVSVEC